MPSPSTASSKAEKKRPDPAPPVEHCSLDFGDAEFTVREFPDGMWTIETCGDRLLVNTEQMQTIIDQAAHIGRAKGWIP